MTPHSSILSPSSGTKGTKRVRASRSSSAAQEEPRPADTPRVPRTMISMELQRDVPQYMAIPWLMTWVMARTVSVMREGEQRWGRLGAQPCLGTFCKHRQGAGGGLQRCLASSVLPGSEAGVGGPGGMKSESPSKKLKAISPASHRPSGFLKHG